AWDIPPTTDVQEQPAVFTLRGHTGGVLSVAVSPDRSLIATAGVDGLAKLWDAQTGAELMTLFGHDRLAHTVTFSPDGRFIATASGDGTVMLRLVHVEDLVELARERATRGLTEDECQRYLHLEACPAD
ncbi:MAG TPA: serine/threonine protein kinase, partial [Actinomycetota bacterium]|nr:serine/threonine protein kinase [Actinomycetota bacterium]